MLGYLRLSLRLIIKRLQPGSHIRLLLLLQAYALPPLTLPSPCGRGRLSHFLLLAGAVECQTGIAWDQAADDDVFLQAAQAVALAHDRRFGQDAGGFLERYGRDEGVGRQRCLGNTQQHVFVGRRQFACGFHTVVLFQQRRTLHLLVDHIVCRRLPGSRCASRSGGGSLR